MSLSLSLWLWKQETVTLDFFLRTVFVQPNKSNWLGQSQWTSTSKRANHGAGQNMQPTWRAGKRLLLCVGDWFSHSANHNTAEDHACQLLHKLDQISEAGGATKRGETQAVFAFLSNWPRIWREILSQSLNTVMQNRSNWARGGGGGIHVTSRSYSVSTMNNGLNCRKELKSNIFRCDHIWPILAFLDSPRHSLS